MIHPHHRTRPTPQAPAALTCLAVLLALGCARESASQKEAQSPAPAAAEPQGITDAGANVEKAEGALSPSSSTSKGSEGKPQEAAEEKDDSEASAHDDRGEAESPKKKNASADGLSPTRPGQAPTEPMALLAEQTDALSRLLSPEALSCTGAKPYRDAICDLAARICETQGPGPSTLSPSDCKEAGEACSSAKADFKKKCGG